MFTKSALTALLGLAALSEASMDRSAFRLARRDLVQRQPARGGNRGGAAGGAAGSGATQTSGGGGGAASGASVTCLAADSLQTGSESTGQQNNVAADGQSNSAT